MEKQFVTYEIALKLKKLDFNDKCFGLYKNGVFYRDYETFQWNDFSNCIKVPLWQQVIDWFREKHDIHISFVPEYNPNKFQKLMYSYAISYQNNNYGGIDDNLDAWLQLSDNGINYHICENYDIAKEQAILKTIELCQNK